MEARSEGASVASQTRGEAMSTKMIVVVSAWVLIIAVAILANGYGY